MNKTAEQARLPKKLVLHKETLRLLTQPELLQIQGGVTVGCSRLVAELELANALVPRSLDEIGG